MAVERSASLSQPKKCNCTTTSPRTGSSRTTKLSLTGPPSPANIDRCRSVPVEPSLAPSSFSVPVRSRMRGQPRESGSDNFAMHRQEAAISSCERYSVRRSTLSNSFDCWMRFWTTRTTGRRLELPHDHTGFLQFFEQRRFRYADAVSDLLNRQTRFVEFRALTYDVT